MAELAGDTRYYWRIDEVNTDGTTAGVIWSFVTGAAPSLAAMYAADIDGVATPAARNRWQADVNVRVVDEGGLPLSNATVDVQWSNGANGSDSLATDGSGLVSFSKGNLKAGVASVTLAVTGVTHAGTYQYQPTLNEDGDGDSDGTVIVVLRDAPPPPANTIPFTSIISPTDGAVFATGNGITFSGQSLDDEDGDLSASIAWSVDGAEVGAGSNIVHDFSDGPHTIIASATDSGGLSGNDLIAITVGEVTTSTVHVADVTNVSTDDSRRWTATALVLVKDSGDSRVSGATVSGSWSAGAKGGGSCTTGGSGECSLSKGMKLNTSSVTLTIDGITGSGLVFDPSGTSQIILTPLP